MATVAGMGAVPYTNDAYTVLLEHFDGSTTGAQYDVYNAVGSGSPYPQTNHAIEYAVGQAGLSNALQMAHPAGLTEPAFSYLTFPGTDPLCQANGTLEFWVRLSSYGSNGVGLVDQGEYYGAPMGWTFSMGVRSNGVLQAGAWNAFELNSGSDVVPLNQWAHVAITWGSAGGKMYIDGELVGTHASVNAPASGFGGKFLAQFGTAEPGAVVLIDELRISSIQRTFEAPVPPGGPKGSWLIRPSAPNPRYDTSVGVFNDQLYLVEGNGGSPPPTQVYNPLTYQWTSRSPGSFARFFGAAAMISDRLYVAGGSWLSGGQTTNLFVAYDMGSSSATAKAPLRTVRTRAAAAALGNRIFVVGGVSNGNALATLEVYDPAKDRWVAKAPMPTPRESAVAAAIGGKIYVVGGLGGVTTNLVEVYDPASDAWTSLAPLPTARRQPAVGVLNGKIHVVGGVAATVTNIHEVLDPSTGEWTTLAPRNFAVSHLANGNVAVRGTLCVPGGMENSMLEMYFPPLAGPEYPPPLGASYGASGTAGRSGGVTWSFSPVPLRNGTFVYWGATNNGVRLSFNNSQFSGSGETMTYDAVQSYLSTGLVVWTGHTFIPGSGSTIYTRCVLSTSVNGNPPTLSSATSVDLPDNIGGLLNVWPSTAYQANIRFEAAYSASGPFYPALDLYDAAFKPYGSGTAFSSFSAGFYYVDQPPTISPVDNRVTQINTATGPIAFTVADLETAASALGVTALSGNTNLVPPAGIVLGGTGSNRTVAITPASNLVGETTITLTVTNARGYSDTTFFLSVNSPPQLNANNALTVDAGASGAITNGLLVATDGQSGPEDLIYTINPDGGGGPPHEGLLQLNGTNLFSGDTFTQADVDAGRLIYVSTNRCATTDDFQFNVADGDGGITPTGEHTAYSFRIYITPVHLPFTVNDAQITVGLGGTVTGQLTAVNSNCPPPTLVYRLVGAAAKGTAAVETNGSFTYTASLGESGGDQFLFQAHDGTSDAVAPGTVSVQIARMPPIPVNSSTGALEGATCGGQVSATQPNNPPFPMTYAIDSQGTKGTVVITDPATGAFSYSPNPGEFGTDTFTFTASDGVLTSLAGTFTVVIRPRLSDNDILVADSGARSVILVRPPSGNQFPLSTNGWLQNPNAVAIEPTGSLIVLDSASGLVRVDPLTGAQAQLTAASNFSTAPIGPTSVAIESDSTILVADGLNGVVRVDPVSGTVTNFASGGLLPICQGVVVGDDSSVYITVPGAMGGGDSTIVRVDPATMGQTLISGGGPLLLPLGQALGNDGKIYVTDVASFGGMPPDKLIAVDRASGVASVLSTNEMLNVPTGLGRSTNNTLFIACNGSATILEATTNGVLQVLSSGGMLVQPFGLTVVRQAPRISGIHGLAGGGVRLDIEGEAGHWVVVESSTNLIQWLPLTVLPNATGSLQYDDPEAVSLPKRFYRLRRF